MEPLYKDTPEIRIPPLARTPSKVPAKYIEKYNKSTPEMRTPPLITTL